MHEPMVVAFELRRPWPRRQKRPPSRVTLSGRLHLYWPVMITVWHVEPGGRDSGTVCQRNGSWRWHIHHWRIRIGPLQDLRRWLLTRCAWCGGPSRRGARVDVSQSWDCPRGRWWRGEPGLFHADCSSAEHAARSCTCAAPIPEHDDWGRCARCALFYGYGRTPRETARLRLMKRCPANTRPSPLLITQVRELARADRGGAA